MRPMGTPSCRAPQQAARHLFSFVVAEVTEEAGAAGPQKLFEVVLIGAQGFTVLLWYWTFWGLVLRLRQTGQEIVGAACLQDQWYDSDVKPGDRINLLRDPGSEDEPGLQDAPFTVNSQKNLIVLHPQLLLSGSRVARSFGCPRRAVLDERVQAKEATAAALKGTMLHQLFQAALLGDANSLELLSAQAWDIVQNHIDVLYEIKAKEAVVYEELMEKAPQILDFVETFMQAQKSVDFGAKQGMRSICKAEVLDIEESISSPTYGLKGMIDASVRVQEVGRGASIMPFELKTGASVSGQTLLEHRAQVMLYTILMYGELVDAGLLYHMHVDVMQGVTPQRADLVGLVMRRNEMASQLHDASLSQLLPPMLKNLHVCSGCSHLDVCTAYHKTLEGGTAETSGLGKLFEERTGHLSSADAAFLQHWDQLIDLECQAAQAEHSSRDTPDDQGNCCDFMVLIPMPSSHSKSRNMYTFQRSCSHGSATCRAQGGLESSFNPGDHVKLSTKAGQVAVAKGIAKDVTMDSITLDLFRPLRLLSTPECSTSERLLQEQWRIEKSEQATHFAQMRYNFLQLFSPSQFNDNRRRLLIDLQPPVVEGGEDAAGLGQSSSRSCLDKAGVINKDQQAAVHRILGTSEYMLVQGMPGTGKTVTIMHAVCALVERGQSVLLSSYTNSALDNILMKLKEKGVDFLRLGRPGAIHPDIMSNTIWSPEKCIKSVKDAEALMTRTRVVGVTCLGVNHPLLHDKHFDVCILDEAGQVTMPIALGPLRLARAFVLVGDDHQLPPLVQSAEARAKGMADSLFSTLSNAHPQAVATLCTQSHVAGQSAALLMDSVSACFQYRMCQDIMDLSNSLVYGGRLVCGSQDIGGACLAYATENDHHAHPAWLLEVLRRQRRAIFLDTDGVAECIETSGRGTVLNRGEVEVVDQIAAALTGRGVQAHFIGVISPYTAQVNALHQRLGHGGLEGLEVHTIDKYQGRDKDCIIVSFVRSSTNDNAGKLLTDWRRINVCLTRAKKKLILVGSKKTLSRFPMLSNLLELMEARKWIVALSDIAVVPSDSLMALRPCSNQQSEATTGTSPAKLSVVELPQDKPAQSWRPLCQAPKRQAKVQSTLEAFMSTAASAKRTRGREVGPARPPLTALPVNVGCRRQCA
eukprot:SM000015S01150  [mRNA]  locus=s15:37809:45597:- [translate_table: standard]